MDSISEKSAELLRLAECTGLKQRLEDELEAQNLEQRRTLAAELAALPDRRTKELPPLEKAAERAIAEFELAQKKFETARSVRDYAMWQATLARSGLDGRQQKLEWELEKTSPQCLRTVFDHLQLMIESIRHCVRPDYVEQPVGMFSRPRLVQVWNAPEIRSVQEELVAMQGRLRDLMRQPDLTSADARNRSAEVLEMALKVAGPHLEHSPNRFYQSQAAKRFPAKQVAA